MGEVGPFDGTWEGRDGHVTICGDKMRWENGVVSKIMPQSHNRFCIANIWDGELKHYVDLIGDELVWEKGEVWSRVSRHGESVAETSRLLPSESTGPIRSHMRMDP